MNAYIESVIEKCKKRDGNEKEFIQTVEEVLRSLETVIEQHPEYECPTASEETGLILCW